MLVGELAWSRLPSAPSVNTLVASRGSRLLAREVCMCSKLGCPMRGPRCVGPCLVSAPSWSGVPCLRGSSNAEAMPNNIWYTLSPDYHLLYYITYIVGHDARLQYRTIQTFCLFSCESTTYATTQVSMIPGVLPTAAPSPDPYPYGPTNRHQTIRPVLSVV